MGASVRTLPFFSQSSEALSKTQPVEKFFAYATDKLLDYLFEDAPFHIGGFLAVRVDVVRITDALYQVAAFVLYCVYQLPCVRDMANNNDR